jgi:predicted nucleotidyltransferase
VQARSGQPQATTAIDDRLIEDVVRRIVERFRPVRVILFGSFARGDARDHSDLDLFVEMETALRPPQRVVEISREFGLRPWALDVIVYTPEEAERFRRTPGSFLNSIEAEGKVLYERG